VLKVQRHNIHNKSEFAVLVRFFTLPGMTRINILIISPVFYRSHCIIKQEKGSKIEDFG
jgi:hypothetical protein